MTRLEKIVGKDTFEYIFAIYKDAKQRHDLYKLLTVKSFVNRMVEAQHETRTLNGKCVRLYTTVESFFKVIRIGAHTSNMTPLEYIIYLCETIHSFSYKKEKDFGKLL